MKTQMRKLLLLMLVSLQFQFIGWSQETCKEVIGYYPNWQWYDRNKLVNPQSIHYDKYSVINYCFFKPNPDGSISSTDEWADENLLLGQINWSTGGYYPNTSIVELAHNAGTKIIPSIGGWTLSDNFPSIAADPVKRLAFANACVNLVNQYNFDGIDIDWEYPGFADHNGTANDITNYTLFLQEIRNALDQAEISNNKEYILTAAVGAAPERMDDVNWSEIVQILDMINLMSYDFFGAWDPITNHNAPLNAPAQGNPAFNINAAVNKLVNDYLVPSNKINVGVPFYGRSVKTNGAPSLHGSSSGLADTGTFGVDEGTPLYYNVLLNQDQFDFYWDATAEVSYALGKNGLNTFLSFDDVQSVEKKSQFIVDNNLLGAIIWEITGDYIETAPGSGIIAETPLVDKINDVFCNYNSEVEDLTVSQSGPSQFCDGGSVVLTASSSNVVWSNGATTTSITVVETGDYYYTSLGSGNVSETIHVAVHSNPTIVNLSENQPSECNGEGSVVLETSINTGSLTWTGTSSGSIAINGSSSTVTGLSEGVYSFICTSSEGCWSEPISAELIDPSPEAPIIEADETVLCPGSSIEISSSNADEYVWNNGETDPSILVTNAGEYYVNAVISGCQLVSNSIFITDAIEPNFAIQPIGLIGVSEMPFELTNVSPSGGSYSGNGVTNNYFDPQSAGVGTHLITYTLEDENGCSFTTDFDLTVQDDLGISEENLVVTMQPNPAMNLVEIKCEVPTSVKLLDMNGKIVVAEHSYENSHSIDITGLRSGIYIVEIQSSQLRIQKKLIKL